MADGTFQGKARVELIEPTEMETNSETHTLAKTNTDVEEEKATPCTSGFLPPENSIICHRISNTEKLQTYNDFETSLLNEHSSLNEHSCCQKYMQITFKPYACSECPKKFSQSADLNRHLKIHSGERPFPCPLCEKRFTLKHHLDGHLKIHTGEKPFPCDKCDKGFLRKDRLYKHKKTHLNTLL